MISESNGLPPYQYFGKCLLEYFGSRGYSDAAQVQQELSNWGRETGADRSLLTSQILNRFSHLAQANETSVNEEIYNCFTNGEPRSPEEFMAAFKGKRN